MNITDAAEYAAYRTWALGLEGMTAQQVKDSVYAWLSYALDTDALITAAPMEGDVVIDTFEGSATDGEFEFAVKIDGIAVGDDALEANIRKVFDIEGAEKLASDGAGFSPDNVEVNAAAPENGNVKFTVTPKGGGEGTRRLTSFFFRVKMKCGKGAHVWHSKDSAYGRKIEEKYRHPMWREAGAIAKLAGGHGGKDFMMDLRWAYCLQNGLPLDIDVYDSMTWSCIVDLSERSVRSGSMPQKVPDFTKGGWKTAKPVGDMSIDLAKLGLTDAQRALIGRQRAGF